MTPALAPDCRIRSAALVFQQTRVMLPLPPHNDRFTFEVPATFTYNACMGQSVWFEGADDCWIYIDDQLVIDLGGVTPGSGQFAELDRLPLEDGKTYSFRLFYAHRGGDAPRFDFRTNIPLVPGPVTAGVTGQAHYD